MGRLCRVYYKGEARTSVMTRGGMKLKSESIIHTFCIRMFDSVLLMGIFERRKLVM